MDINQKRVVALVGHAHAGKTSLAESLLFASGSIARKGEVMKGNTVSDFQDDEIERKISISASFLRLTHKDCQIQMVDTPGYSDFVGETAAAVRVVDGAVVVVDAVNGVEVGTEDAWQRLEELQTPRIIFINKTEKSDADVQAAIHSVQEQLSGHAHVLDFAAADFIESIAESDDKLLEKYLDQGSLTEEELRTALRRAVIASKVFPIICGSALADAGIKDLLDAIAFYLPSPLEHPAFEVRDIESQQVKVLTPACDGPFTGFIFKSLFDPHLGQLALMRVLRGHLPANADFFNVTQGSREHISSLTILQGKDQISVPEAECGDIVAIPKLKSAHSCDCLTDLKDKCLIDPISFPEPSISASIKPRSRADEEKISTGLHRLCEEDHTIKVHRDAETKELIIAGVGDLHLKVAVDRLKRRYNLDVELGTPKVAYRETITRRARARYRYKKQSGGRGQYGDVELEIAPLPRDSGEYEFLNKIFGGAIPRNFIPSVEKGVKQSVTEGVLAGYPMINIQITVVDGSYHDVDSSDMAFQIAGALAFKEAARQAGLALLEPIMDVTIVVPDEFMGVITSDISGKRGRIMGTEAKGKNQAMQAMIPLAEMFRYSTDLRSMTGGRGSYSMKFAHYETVPARITEQIVAERVRAHAGTAAV